MKVNAAKGEDAIL